MKEKPNRSKSTKVQKIKKKKGACTADEYGIKLPDDE
jgi:hypothetical protein